jgi:hypothetical protein
VPKIKAARTGSVGLGCKTATRSFPPHAKEGPSSLSPYPRNARYRWPAASPQRFHLSSSLGIDGSHPQEMSPRTEPMIIRVDALSYNQRPRPLGFIVAFLLNPRRSRMMSGSGEVPGEYPSLAREDGKPWHDFFTAPTTCKNQYEPSK